MSDRPATGLTLGKAFDEAWQAQVLAIADTLIRSGQLTPGAWAEALGAELRRVEAEGHPDTPATYYAAALNALEVLVIAITPISADELTARKVAWTRAFLNTPHGQPVNPSTA